MKEEFKIKELDKIDLANDFYVLIDVMLNENLSEFQYVIKNKKWNRLYGGCRYNFCCTPPCRTTLYGDTKRYDFIGKPLF